MEKQIKMSLETAQKIYKQKSISGDYTLHDWLLENFTKEELEGKKGFIWEDCSPLRGFYFDNRAGTIQQIGGNEVKFFSHNKHVFKTEAQAKSALAFAQLSHIVAKYNDNSYATTDNGSTLLWEVVGYTGGELNVCGVAYFSMVHGVKHLLFNSKEGAEISMKVNRQLWLDYWMIDKKITDL